jgi:hypothetical protein
MPSASKETVMRRSCRAICAALTLLCGAGPGFASSHLEGSLAWTFDASLPPVVGRPFYGPTPTINDSFGGLYFVNAGVISYPGGDWGPYGTAQLSKSPYTFDGNTLAGQSDPGGQQLSFNWTAVSRQAGETAAMQADLFVNFDFPNAQVFPGISYAYSYSGSIDPGGAAGFGVQVELSYFNFPAQVSQIVYSNYGNYGGAYGNVFDPSFPFFAINTPGAFSRSGVFQLGPFAVADSVFCGTGCIEQDWAGASRWQLRFDFMGGGSDLAGLSQPVPEPSSLRLMAAGLATVVAAALGPWRRRSQRA